MQLKNPIFNGNAPDPFITFDAQNGWYYALFSCSNRVELYRSRHAANIISEGECKVIYLPNEADGILGDLWAPEMHKGSNGRWYIYTSGKTADVPKFPWRMFALECQGNDPFGEWKYMGKLFPEICTIDATVYTDPQGGQHLCCARFDKEYGEVLHLYELEDPVTVGKRNAMLSHAELDWELKHGRILEGPFFVRQGERLFLIYSANGYESDDYCLGVLEFSGGDLYDPQNWKKHPRPLLTQGEGAYGPGHASFFRSPDESELWCAYHARIEKESDLPKAAMPRYCFIQKVVVAPDSSLSMGKPQHFFDSPKGEE